MTTPERKHRQSAEKSRDPDLAGAAAAMHRAAEVARRRAMETSGAVAVFKDGKIVQNTATTGLSVNDTERMQA